MQASVSESTAAGKAGEDERQFTVATRWVGSSCGIAWDMDKKQINDPKMTLNFLIWVGGVFMLLLFAFLAHFVWRLF